VYQRALAVLLSAEGKTTREIGEAVRRCHSTVFRWLKRFDERGVAACTPDKSPGRPPKVDADVQATLQEAVARNPRELGYPFTRWTTALLAEHVCGTHHLTLHPATVGDALRGLGYRYGCPKLDLAHRQDPAEVARARRQRNRALKKRPTAKAASRSSTSTKPNST
jgi:transposase